MPRFRIPALSCTIAWVALGGSCASTETTSAQLSTSTPATATAAVAATEVQLDYSALFDVVSSASLYDGAVIRPGLLERVLIENALFTKEDSAEAWLLDLLLAWLGEHGSRIIAPPLPAELEVRAPCPAGGCYQQLPTAVLRHVQFISGTDQVAATVQELAPGSYSVAIRRDPEDRSLCAADYKLPLGYVQLRALVQRLSDGALAALLRETRLLTTPSRPTVAARLPQPTAAAAEFCAGVAQVFEAERAFRRSDSRYVEAARLLLDAAFAPLVPAPESKPAAR